MSRSLKGSHRTTERMLECSRGITSRHTRPFPPYRVRHSGTSNRTSDDNRYAPRSRRRRNSCASRQYRNSAGITWTPLATHCGPRWANWKYPRPSCGDSDSRADSGHPSQLRILTAGTMVVRYNPVSGQSLFVDRFHVRPAVQIIPTGPWIVPYGGGDGGSK